MIEICSGVQISEHELSFSFDRSPGPGGQNANKVNTRVTLHFDITRSTSLSNQQKNTLKKTLATRINQDGVLRIHSSKERTQLANRRAAVNRFIELLAEAFVAPKPRKKTEVPAAADNRRLNGKTHQGSIKRMRSSSVTFDYDD